MELFIAIQPTNEVLVDEWALLGLRGRPEIAPIQNLPRGASTHRARPASSGHGTKHHQAATLSTQDARLVVL